MDSKFGLGLIVGVAVVGLIGLGAFYLGRIYQTPGAPSLEQQRMCAEAAGKAFKDAGNPSATYTSHYDGASGRCFVEIDSHDDVHAFRSVSDALEHTEYAVYAEELTGGVSSLVDCRVRLPNVPFVPCKSLVEWQNLIKPLMGQ